MFAFARRRELQAQQDALGRRLQGSLQTSILPRREAGAKWASLTMRCSGYVRMSGSARKIIASHQKTDDEDYEAEIANLKDIRD